MTRAKRIGRPPVPDHLHRKAINTTVSPDVFTFLRNRANRDGLTSIGIVIDSLVRQAQEST